MPDISSNSQSRSYYNSKTVGCPKCDKTFTSIEKAKEHFEMEYPNGEWKYLRLMNLCKVCEHVTIQESGIKSHMLNKHPDDMSNVIYRRGEGPLDTAVTPSDGSSTTTVDSDMHPSDSDVATSNQASSISAFSLAEDHSVSIIHTDESGSSTNLGSRPDFSQWGEEFHLLCEMFATNPEEDIKGFTARLERLFEKHDEMFPNISTD